jgi:YidC/Oxa1 family membrane protein insertase
VDFNLNWIYYGISWILLRWHELLALVFGEASNASWVLAIVLLVLTVRAVLFPVFVKQIKSQRKMQELQPKLKELQDKHKNDRQTFQVEMAKLLQAEKANPLMGCLPIFLQIPVFLGLFHVLRTINPTSSTAFHAMTEQYGWTVDQFNHASDASLFGAPIAAAFSSKSDFLHELGAQRSTVQIVAAILVLTMVVTTYITQRQMIARTASTATGPQAMIQKFMLYGIPASLLISGGIFPIGVLIYWVVQNFFSMGQQFWVIKRMPPIGGVKKEVSAETAKALAPKPGAKPSKERKTIATASKEIPANPAESNGKVIESTVCEKATVSSGGSGRKSKSKKRKGGRI